MWLGGNTLTGPTDRPWNAAVRCGLHRRGRGLRPRAYSEVRLLHLLAAIMLMAMSPLVAKPVMITVLDSG